MKPVLPIKRRYPNDYKTVEKWQNEMSALRLYDGAIDGVYGEKSEAATKRFQNLRAILDDGIVGLITWGRAFQEEASLDALERSQPAADRFVESFCKNAEHFDGLKELPGNRGKEIDAWLMDLGVQKGSPWCMGFVQAMAKKTAKDYRVPDPLKPDTAHCLTLWRGVPAEWKHGPQDGRRGDIAIWDHGNDSGHTGIVLGYGAGLYTTIEGNTNDDGSREGYEVCKRTRKWNDPRLKGFIRVKWTA